MPQYLLKTPIICSKCKDKLNPVFIKYKEDNISCLSVYNYDENIQGLLYQLKGCFDVELADVFLYDFARILSIYYSGYYIVPIPSYHKHNEKREFNHVKEIFKCLNLKFIDCLIKTSPHKQSDCSYEERTQIQNVLQITHNDLIKGKKILIVDDVYTTGNTIRTAIKLIKNEKPKTIKVLVLSKTIFDENKIKHSMNV